MLKQGSLTINRDDRVEDDKLMLTLDVISSVVKPSREIYQLIT